jgi:hypothetical protein
MIKDDTEDKIIKILKQTEAQQKATIRQFSKLALLDRIYICSKYRQFFYALKHKNEDIEISTLSYIALIKAISKFIKNGDNETRINISKIAIGLKKSRIKSDILLDRWSLIKELRNEHKLSFRDIATYLMKYHKIKIAHSTIFEMWHKLEKNKEE